MPNIVEFCCLKTFGDIEPPPCIYDITTLYKYLRSAKNEETKTKFEVFQDAVVDGLEGAEKEQLYILIDSVEVNFVCIFESYLHLFPILLVVCRKTYIHVTCHECHDMP
jgi:hypothetical protein